ncbi:hypothetical protein [Tepidibacillus fermentans]|uniref:Uncharacterized protein n=1 Tax=Tepidibacillus fermentans TaxID=1281767 RepID=A0A4R3KGH5_9BACI|nr:hypothetical protein [Tepidibacillus fermentans]TCS82516.1 hypothetical protein EDD72_1084 [Tepidibacillus fermentans]
MAIKEFEFMHGGVITRLLRKDVPMQLTLVETNSNDSKAVYKLLTQKNNELILYIKYRSKPEQRKKEGYTWIFNFTQNNLKELCSYKDGNFMVALVCGKEEQLNNSEVCLLDKQQVTSSIDIHSKSSQTITVKLQARKGFRVYGTMTVGESIIVPRNKINTIEV